jgi:photosystem II stability/assembly factor-like uncharacterized protein
MNLLPYIRGAALLGFVLAISGTVDAQTWQPMGPPGGDVRALAVDPSDPLILYLGTTDGHIFGSRDGGDHWKILGRAGSRLDAVVTAILVDPRDSTKLYVSTWTRGAGKEGGGVFESTDTGQTWRPAGLQGHAVRALAQAASDPKILVAGALDGVYRSFDAGANWKRISPEGDEELRNIDSLAIDPHRPATIYAGTFHLPWKTIDGGRHWRPIHSGMIDDSDVLSLVIDATHPQRIYASACSGIYRSDNFGLLWKKIHGIPFSARRTYVIRQDPSKPAIVYAGTSEGLWRSLDAGASWRRVTPADWVINTLVVLPQGELKSEDKQGGRLLIGTDQLGALASDDEGGHFRSANNGFNHRQIVSLALDRSHSGRVLAILANAPEPALATDDAGKTWAPLGPGLRMEGLRRVYASPDGWWAALERGGLMRYDAKKGSWARAGILVGEAANQAQRKGKHVFAGKTQPFELPVNDMAFARNIWFAATGNGLFASRDRGTTWSLFPFAPLVLPVSSVRVSSDGRQLWVVSLRGMVFSQNGGKTWSWHDLPFEAGGALRLDVADESTLVATAQNGLYVSRNAGKQWRLAANGLPQAPVQDLALTGQVWLASMQTGGLYISYDRGRTWARIEGTLAEGFFPVVTAGQVADVVYAASTTEGLYAVELEGRAETAQAGASGR